MSTKNDERVAIRRAVTGLVTIALLLTVAINLSTITGLFGSRGVSAELVDGGGIRSGDDVRLYGLKVGKVTGLRLEAKTVRLEFDVDSSVDLGDKSRLYIRSDNALGRKYVDLEPDGRGDVDKIPASRTDPGYAVTEVLGDLTKTSQQLDTGKLEQAFVSMSELLDGSPAEFGKALNGVKRLSKTLSSRDQELETLLQKASSVSEVLAQRNEQISGIFGNGSAILQELVERRRFVSSLLSDIASATRQINGFVKDNEKQLPDSLTKLKGVSDILASYRADLESAIVDLSGYVRGLGDAVASGPFFQALVANLTTPESIGTGIPSSLLGGAK